MKKIWILALAMVGLMALSGAAMAADKVSSSLYMDYSQMNASDTDADLITLGGDFTYNHIMFGGFISDVTKYDPDIPGASTDYFMTYIGYNFLDSDTNALGIIGGYGALRDKESGDKLNADSFMLGFRGAFRQDAFNFSLAYLFGIHNTMKLDGAKLDDPEFSMLEMKVGYDFTDNFGLYLSYRDYQADSDTLDGGGIDGLGLGAQFRF